MSDEEKKEEVEIEPEEESAAMNMYRERLDEAMESIEVDDVRKDDLVDYIFKIGNKLHSQNLDEMSLDTLMRIGGRLTGIYSSISNKASYARARRDISENKMEDIKSELMISNYGKSDNKVTLSRAKTKVQMKGIKEEVAKIEREKRDYENALKACETMISFIQSAIRVKQSNMYRGRMSDNN